MYSVGELRYPAKGDPCFETMTLAEHYARKESYPDRVLGIWCDEDLVAIAYNGLVYWP